MVPARYEGDEGVFLALRCWCESLAGKGVKRTRMRCCAGYEKRRLRGAKADQWQCIANLPLVFLVVCARGAAQNAKIFFLVSAARRPDAAASPTAAAATRACPPARSAPCGSLLLALVLVRVDQLLAQRLPRLALAAPAARRLGRRLGRRERIVVVALAAVRLEPVLADAAHCVRAGENGGGRSVPLPLRARRCTQPPRGEREHAGGKGAPGHLYQNASLLRLPLRRCAGARAAQAGRALATPKKALEFETQCLQWAERHRAAWAAFEASGAAAAEAAPPDDRCMCHSCTARPGAGRDEQAEDAATAAARAEPPPSGPASNLGVDMELLWCANNTSLSPLRNTGPTTGGGGAQGAALRRLVASGARPVLAVDPRVHAGALSRRPPRTRRQCALEGLR